MSKLAYGPKRKRDECELSDSEKSKNSNDLNQDASSSKITSLDMGDLGNTMDESSETESDDNAQRRKILSKFRKKLRKEKVERLSPSVYDAKNSVSDTEDDKGKELLGKELGTLHQNQLGDPLVQRLMYAEEFEEFQSNDKSQIEEQEDMIAK